MRSADEPTPDSTSDDFHQINADLQRKLREAEAERDEALARETATAEMLQVINTNPGDLIPVFDAMLEKAMRLCDAPCGYFLRREDDNYSLAAGRGLASDFEAY